MDNSKLKKDRFKRVASRRVENFLKRLAVYKNVQMNTIMNITGKI